MNNIKQPKKPTTKQIIIPYNSTLQQLISNINIETIKTISIQIYYSLLQQNIFTKDKTHTASDVTGQIVQYHGSTIRKWVCAWKVRSEKWESKRGKHPKYANPLSDEDLAHKARTWVSLNSCVKGAPNMRVYDFQNYLNTKLLKDILLKPVDESKARRWLMKLGFKVVNLKCILV